MSRTEYRRRRSHRRRSRFNRHLPTFIVLLTLTVLIGGSIFAVSRFVFNKKPAGSSPAAEAIASPNSAQAAVSQTAVTEPEPDGLDGLIAQADRLAAGYDYDAAIALVQNDPAAAADPRGQEAVSRYQAVKDTLTVADHTKITHVFFHSLIVDTSLAFDGDADSKGYNSVMTTVSEFKGMLDEMYKRGYVLVRIHDVAYQEPDENGNMKFVYGKIMLPEGKKPFVMSQDDLCYYDYMHDDGFATKMIIGEDGKPISEMAMADGTVKTGSYDLVPILEDFIQQHPDFSYKGARAILAFTGYQGILGYRTAPSYSSSPTYEDDRKMAAKVAQCLRDNGWELASHSWGHIKLGVAAYPKEGFAVSDERFQTDTDKWEAEVEPLTGPTDIMVYPFGNDISNFHPYTDDNPRFTYLESKGFRYFCNVDASTPYWMQMGPNYFRMARRNLDGYRLYQDVIAPDPSKKRLSDLFDAAEIFDPARPTPVTWY